MMPGSYGFTPRFGFGRSPLIRAPGAAMSATGWKLTWASPAGSSAHLRRRPLYNPKLRHINTFKSLFQYLDARSCQGVRTPEYIIGNNVNTRQPRQPRLNYEHRIGPGPQCLDMRSVINQLWQGYSAPSGPCARCSGQRPLRLHMYESASRFPIQTTRDFRSRTTY